MPDPVSISTQAANVQEPTLMSKHHAVSGRAWLVVLGGTCNFFATFGLINTWGAFQAYYEDHVLHDDASAIAWIGSIQYSLLFLPGIMAGRLLDHGVYRLPLFIASTLLVIMTFLTGSCTRYWQFLIVQGVVTGICSGIIFGPTISVVGQWFIERRALALGLVATGSSIGGLVMPIFFRCIVAQIGFSWAMRSIALMQLCAFGISNLTLRMRVVPSACRQGGPFDFNILKSPAFLFYFSSAIFTFMGSTTLMSYLGVSAITGGVNREVAPYLLSILNASSTIGRVSSGLLADRFGAMNTLIPFIATVSVVTYAWPFARSAGDFVAVAVSFGAASGAYMSLSSLPILRLGDKHDAGSRLGLFQVAMMSSLVGSPISGAILDRTHQFQNVGIYAGSMLMLSVVLMLVARHFMVPSLKTNIIFCKI